MKVRMYENYGENKPWLADLEKYKGWCRLDGESMIFFVPEDEFDEDDEYYDYYSDKFDEEYEVPLDDVSQEHVIENYIEDAYGYRGTGLASFLDIYLSGDECIKLLSKFGAIRAFQAADKNDKRALAAVLDDAGITSEEVASFIVHDLHQGYEWSRDIIVPGDIID